MDDAVRQPEHNVMTSEQFRAMMAKARETMAPARINGGECYVLFAAGEYPEGGTPVRTPHGWGVAYPADLSPTVRDARPE